MTVPRLALLGCLAVATAGCRAHQVVVERPLYHGFEAIVLRNGVARVTVVPATGRVVELGLLKDGAARGPFWEHPAFAPGLAADAGGWINFGGDKAWPAPQADWPKLTGEAWPPPRTFDAMPFSATVAGGAVEMTSPIDPDYGVRVRRRIALDPTTPVMTIETRYEKVQGPPVTVGVWTITQLEPPERMFVRLPVRSAFPGGHRSKLAAAPRELRVDGRLLSLARDPAEKTQIVSDGDALLWVGDGPDLLLEALPAAAGSGTGDWPEGAHAQIYTSPDGDQHYVELELLDRLHRLGPGDSAAFTVRYTLIPRSETDPLREAQKVLR